MQSALRPESRETRGGSWDGGETVRYCVVASNIGGPEDELSLREKCEFVLSVEFMYFVSSFSGHSRFSSTTTAASLGWTGVEANEAGPRGALGCVGRTWAGVEEGASRFCCMEGPSRKKGRGKKREPRDDPSYPFFFTSFLLFLPRVPGAGAGAGANSRSKAVRCGAVRCEMQQGGGRVGVDFAFRRLRPLVLARATLFRWPSRAEGG